MDTSAFNSSLEKVGALGDPGMTRIGPSDQTTLMRAFEATEPSEALVDLMRLHKVFLLSARLASRREPGEA